MPRTITLLFVSGSLLGATALTACGGSSDATTTTAAVAPPTATATATPRAQSTNAQAGIKAKIAGFAFAPQDITVKVGQSITWTNEDAAAHTVSAQSGAAFDSGTLAQGAGYTWKATKAGTITYICSIHPSMTGKITVE